MENEIWKDVIGYEGIYQISNFGKVKSLDRYTFRVRKYHFFNGKIRCPQLNNKGYEVIDFEIKGKRKKYFVHRLVAIHFIPNTQNKPNVNHKDSNPLNNHYKNLEWVTQKENMQHASIYGRSKGIVSDEKVIEIFNSTKKHIEIKNEFNVSLSTIARIKRGEGYCHITKFYSEKKFKDKHYSQKQSLNASNKSNLKREL